MFSESFPGLALIGLTTSADANIGKGYTLLSIAGVILGGGEFVGGRVSPIGAVIGALTLTLAGSLLNFMRISPDWQVGAQGGILIIVLAARAMIKPDRSENAMKVVGRFKIFAKPWIWSYLGAFLVWLAAIVFTHGYGAGGMITAALALAVFSVIAGVAQMFVITLGPGNVDLSLPANIGLASAVAMKMMNGSDSLIAVGFLAALASGICIGIFNYLLIWLLRIPPIISTLSASFIIQSVGISYGRGLQIKPPPGYAQFTSGSSRWNPFPGDWHCDFHVRRGSDFASNHLRPFGPCDRPESSGCLARWNCRGARSIRNLRAERSAWRDLRIASGGLFSRVVARNR